MIARRRWPALEPAPVPAPALVLVPALVLELVLVLAPAPVEPAKVRAHFHSRLRPPTTFAHKLEVGQCRVHCQLHSLRYLRARPVQIHPSEDDSPKACPNVAAAAVDTAKPPAPMDYLVAPIVANALVAKRAAPRMFAGRSPQNFATPKKSRLPRRLHLAPPAVPAPHAHHSHYSHHSQMRTNSTTPKATPRAYLPWPSTLPT